MTPSEYKKFKNLERENLRDHMTDLELIFSMLGEAATTEITRNIDAQGFDENLEASRQGGEVAGNARRDLEKKSGKKSIEYKLGELGRDANSDQVDEIVRRVKDLGIKKKGLLTDEEFKRVVDEVL